MNFSFNCYIHSTCKKVNNKCSYGCLHKCVNAVLFGLPAFTDPKALPVNTQRQLTNCNILWTLVISAGQSLLLPLDSCCSFSLVSTAYAEKVIAKCPSNQYQKLPEPIPVSIADATSTLTAIATMDVPITWNNGRETTFTMLVVPQLAWPILLGENHLHATKALVDHAQPSITFRHPNMQFTVSCSLDNLVTGFSTTASAPPGTPNSSSDSNRKPHVGVRCLLTKMSFVW